MAEKMTLLDYYNNLEIRSPRNLFREDMIAKCNISQSTFHLWITGKVKIPVKAKEIIAKMTNLPIDELFPHQKIKSLDEDEYRLDRIIDGQGKLKETLTVNEALKKKPLKLQGTEHNT